MPRVLNRTQAVQEHKHSVKSKNLTPPHTCVSIVDCSTNKKN